jgi:hypothetical protein
MLAETPPLEGTGAGLLASPTCRGRKKTNWQDELYIITYFDISRNKYLYMIIVVRIYFLEV